MDEFNKQFPSMAGMQFEAEPEPQEGFVEVVTITDVMDNCLDQDHMFKISDFKKCCPVCQRLSLSMRKTHCDHDGAELILISKEYCETSHTAETNLFEFKLKGFEE